MGTQAGPGRKTEGSQARERDSSSTHRRTHQEDVGSKQAKDKGDGGRITRAKKGKRVQHPGYTAAMNSSHVKQINIPGTAHSSMRRRGGRKDTEEVEPEIVRIGAARRRRGAGEEQVLNNTPLTLKFSSTMAAMMKQILVAVWTSTRAMGMQRVPVDRHR